LQDLYSFLKIRFAMLYDDVRHSGSGTVIDVYVQGLNRVLVSAPGGTEGKTERE